jgi:type II secretory pathway predicted ATPase ExeA
MFKQFFGMKLNPFEKEVQSADMFESGDLTELRSRFKYVLDCRGIFVLVGEPGAGKTAALRKFTSSLAPSLYRPVYLALTTVTVMDFYRAMTSLLGEQPRYRKIDMFGQIQSAICALYYEQRITPVIIVDEAHMASTSILDDLRMIFNFSMDSKTPFILVLAGQSMIKNKLALNMCLPLRQRITARYTMRGLTLTETSQYLSSRMTVAGVSKPVFTEQAVAGIHSCSNGYPRNINNLATQALIYCTFKKQDTVDDEAVFNANLELST